MGPSRRIAAIVLPQLACELVRQRVTASTADRGKAPLAVILEESVHAVGSSPAQGREGLPATAVIHVVDEEARRYGVRPGQRVTEASALVAHLAIHRVTFAEIDAALGRVAELALALGPTAAIQLGARIEPGDRSAWGRGPYDTVWLDITGAAHLVGGEEALCDELAERLSVLGHRARIGISDGPRIAQALARWGVSEGGHGSGSRGERGERGDGERAGALPSRGLIAPAGRGAEALAPLPVQALPLESEVASFLVRVGLLKVGDLAKLPRAAAAARLGKAAAEIMALTGGFDAAPLVPFQPPRVLEEETSFEDSVEGSEPLLFVLRGMTSRVGARLEARGEAAGLLEVMIPYDRSVSRLRLLDLDRPLAEGEDGEGLRFSVELPAPLADAADLLRPLKARLEQIALLAPAVGVKLTASQIVPARRVQMDLSRDQSTDPDSLPALLAELSAEIGAERIGVLEVVDAHRPESRSRLAPASLDKANRAAAPAPAGVEGMAPPAPARMLPRPIPLGQVGRGAIVAVERQIFTVERMRFVMRLDGVEWWTSTPVSRDYFKAWFSASAPGSVGGVGGATSGGAGGAGGARLSAAGEGRSAGPAGEAWIYVDRATGEAFLQGWCE
ncbi:DinB/UmuC family translesion DNA polymerase [Chondromyces apiculatus]|nr:DNA polymerase Y family protein [Chondromyces apiculatus]